MYLGLLDLKLDKLREKNDGIINQNTIKKTELLKCNTYCKGVIAMFVHFTNMYSTAGGRNDLKFNINDFDKCSVQELINSSCTAPDESTYTNSTYVLQYYLFLPLL